MNSIKRISVSDADRILASRADALLLDIREQRDFEQGHHPKAQLLSEALLNKIIRTSPKSTAIIIYCYHGVKSQDFARMFAQFGFKDCYSVDGGYTSWRVQVDKDFPISNKLDRWLSSKGIADCDVNARINAQHQTPLMLAAKQGRADLVHELVEAGADPNLTDVNGNNSLVHACLGRQQECIRLLINADVEIDNSNVYGFTAMDYSVGMEEVITLLKGYFYDNSLVRFGRRLSSSSASKANQYATAI